MPLLLIRMIFFWEMNMFLQLKWLGIFGTKWAFLNLENCDLHDVLLSTTNSIVSGKQCARGCSFYHGWFSVERFMSFFNSAVKDYLDHADPLSTLKYLHFRKYSFQRLTPFSQGNNVLHAAASNIDGFHRRDKCASPSHLNRTIWSKMSWFTGSIPPKTN
jgi:hypothetical protein